MTLDQLLRLIRGARRVPAERDSLYKIIRRFDDVAASEAA
jgi:2-iminoacetate synthase ThiH